MYTTFVRVRVYTLNYMLRHAEKDNGSRPRFTRHKNSLYIYYINVLKVFEYNYNIYIYRYSRYTHDY